MTEEDDTTLKGLLLLWSWWFSGDGGQRLYNDDDNSELFGGRTGLGGCTWSTFFGGSCSGCWDLGVASGGPVVDVLLSLSSESRFCLEQHEKAPAFLSKVGYSMTVGDLGTPTFEKLPLRLPVSELLDKEFFLCNIPLLVTLFLGLFLLTGLVSSEELELFPLLNLLIMSETFAL